MLIKTPLGWELPERIVTPETAYVSRRQLLAAAGFLSVPALARDARPNAEYQLDYPVTEEWAATSYNNFYEFNADDKRKVKDEVGRFITSPWRVQIGGLVARPQTLDLDDLRRRFPLEERVYHHRCVEAWAMTVPWTGFPLAALIKAVQPSAAAKWVRFVTAHRPDEMPGIKRYNWYPWPYFEALRMDEAMNPLTLVVTGIYGKALPRQNGAPIRIVTPWKYGFKSVKSIERIEFVAERPATFWNQQQPAEFGFFSNVNPRRPHPRWSQATEKVIPEMEVQATRLYNGYGRWVASMYNGSEF